LEFSKNSPSSRQVEDEWVSGSDGGGGMDNWRG